MPGEPSLSEAEVALLAKGIREFNAGYFFECHDTLEDLWSGIRGDSREFFQGLIQAAVAFYHVGRGNTAGALSMLERSLARLAKYPARYYGFDVAAHRQELSGWSERLRAGESDNPPLDSLPKWRFDRG